jgi:hypothetical protein
MNTILLHTVLFILLALPAHAHKPSDSYLSIKVEGKQIHGQWDIALRDLDDAIGLDENGDGAITWGELRSRHDAIATYALPKLTLQADSGACLLGQPTHWVNEHTDGTYAVLAFQAECPSPPQALDLEYRLFFDINPQHRGLLLPNANQTTPVIFSPERQRHRILGAAESLSPSSFQVLLDFGREGIWHIANGFDHILFLISLLLPAVLQRVERRWEAVSSFGKAFWDVFKIVTAFTLAHSITLVLAALSVIQLPSRWVESAIAVSIILAAANNLYPLFKQEDRYLVAFGFGLIHGFGFASVLADLAFSSRVLIRALIGFNFGIEIGQAMIVALFFPMAYTLRNSWVYRRITFSMGSAAIIVLASIWTVERVFNLKIISF